MKDNIDPLEIKRAVDSLFISKSQQLTPRRELSRDEIKMFLQLVSQIQPPILFKRKLEMSSSDVEFYKKQLNIGNESEARKMLLQMNHDDETLREKDIISNRQQQMEAERVANERLDQMARERAERVSNRPVLDASTIREDETKKLRRFREQQLEQSVKSNWRLPVSEDRKLSPEATVDQFRRDITNRGVSFCLTKYGCKYTDIVAEANRLDLKIDWDTVRR